MATWHNVSRKEPCPICQKPDWCTLSNDGMMCVCKRVPSPHPAKSGQGWIHVLVERPRRVFIPPAPRRPQRRLFDASAAMRGYWAEFSPARLHELSEILFMHPAAIECVQPGFSAFYKAWAFPMRNGNGEVVGIRMREYFGSKKWSVSGSRDGLFYDPELKPREAVENGIKGREIVVVEGATDCIAGYTLGLPTVGRSSCATGGEHIRVLCRRLKVSRITIVSDNDAYKVRPDGTPWRPGIEGAKRLASTAGLLTRVIVPPVNDLREWWQNGLTSRQFWELAAVQSWKVHT